MLSNASEPRVDFVRRERGEPERVAAVDFVEPNLNLLAHAQSIELDVGSVCGGHGVCGGDRVRILDRAPPLSEITDAERRHLSAAELAAGYRLACQCFPESAEFSLRVEILPG